MAAQIPPVSLDLSDFLRPSGFATEWVYGPARNDWLGTHPITAYGDVEDGEPLVEFSGPLGLVRDQLPHLIAWLTAVHEATEPPADEVVERDDQIVEALRTVHGPGRCACAGRLPVSTHRHGVASCVAGRAS